MLKAFTHHFTATIAFLGFICFATPNTTQAEDALTTAPASKSLASRCGPAIGKLFRLMPKILMVPKVPEDQRTRYMITRFGLALLAGGVLVAVPGQSMLPIDMTSLTVSAVISAALSAYPPRLRQFSANHPNLVRLAAISPSLARVGLVFLTPGPQLAFYLPYFLKTGANILEYLAADALIHRLFIRRASTTTTEPDTTPK